MDSNTSTSRPTKLDPTDNKLQISNRKNARNYIFIGKIFLRKFETIELHALGEATKTVVRVAENLARQGCQYISKSPQGIATISKIESFTHQIENTKRVKLVVTLTVTAEGRKRLLEEIEN